MMYASWDMDCNRQIFLSFWDIFCSFTPSHSPHLTIKKIEKNKKKRKKSPIDIILLHVCTINEDYMMHGSWDKRCNRQEIFGRFLALLPLPLTIQNMKILKKWKKHFDILSFYTCVPKMTIIWCMVPEIWSVTDIIFCQFGPFFPFHTLTIWIIKILKNSHKRNKHTWAYNFTLVCQKLWSYAILFRRHGT